MTTGDVPDVRARLRPRVVVYVWAFELLCAFVVSAPLTAWLGATFGGRPDGDAVVFRPGGFALVSWVFDEGPGLAVVLRTVAISLAVVLLLGQLVTGAVIAALGDEDGRPIPIPRAIGVGAQSFLPLAGLTAATLVLQVVVLVGAVTLGGMIFQWLTPSIGDQRATLWLFATVGLGAILAFALGVAADLARVTIVTDARDRALAWRATAARALRFAARALPRGFAAWAWRAVIAVALVVTGALLADRFGPASGALLWALFFLHQGIVFARAALRVSWLARALRLAASTAT